MDRPEGKLIKVFIGQVIVTRSPNVLQTVLGSCVGVAMFDPQAGLGGMAHVFLPSSVGKAEDELPGKYADRAVDCLHAGLCRHGAVAARLRAKLAGGAQLFATLLNGRGDVGSGILDVVHRRLGELRIPVVASAVGGSHGRRVAFDVATCLYHVEDFAQRRDIL